MLAAAIAALPLVLLVAYSAGNRYNADRDRAKTRAAARSQLLATLVAESPRTPTQADIARLLPLPPIVTGSVIEVFARDGNVVASGGPEKALLQGDDSQIAAALAQPGQTVDVKGADGVKRVWGFAAVDGKPLVVAYAIPGNAV